METTARLIVDIPRLAPEGEQLTGNLAPEALDYGENDAGIAPEGPLHYDLHVQRLDSELLVRGSTAQIVRATCSRCGESFLLTAREDDFLQSFQIIGANDCIDLTPALREGIILALPTYPLCSADCKGLCVHCCHNLNKGKCSCGGSDEPNAPWAVLEQLNL